MDGTERALPTRRQAIGAAIAGTLAIAGAASLAGCAGDSPAERIEQANSELIGGIDAKDARLPIGSVVETTFGGRWMIAGHKVVRMADGEQYCYDYYGIGWPGGVKYAGYEEIDGAVFDKAHVVSICFVGYNNDEDKDFRAYIEAYDAAKYSPLAFNGKPGPLVATSKAPQEQALRAQGMLSQELYGDAFDGGALYSGERESGGE